MDLVYTDIIRHDHVPFEDYLKLEGKSHSFIKSNVAGMKRFIDVTDNMRFGSLVDGILTEPETVDMASPNYDSAVRVAKELKSEFGDMITSSSKQVSYQANIKMEGFKLLTTGRLDFLIEGMAVVDLKVTQSKVGSIKNLINYMGYENQVWHYAKMAQVDMAFLLVYSVPDMKAVVKQVDASTTYNDFWANAVLDFGSKSSG